MSRPSSPSTSSEDDEDGATKPGTLEKTFAGAKGTVRLDYDGQSITDPTLADQVLAELTGIPTEAFFRSTASVRHHELADLARDEAALRDRLQASISGADRGTSQAKKKLEKALHEPERPRATRTPADSRSPRRAVAQSQAAVEQGDAAARPARAATATRSPAPSRGGPRPRPPSSSGAPCSRRPARPSG